MPTPKKPMEVSMKLWLTSEQYEWLEREAREREWRVPHMVRRLIEDALAERDALEGGQKRKR